MQYFFAILVVWISRATNYMIRRMPLPNPIFSGKWWQKVSLNIYCGSVVSIDQIISWIRYWIEDWGDEVTSFPKNVESQIFWVISGQMLNKMWWGLTEKIERFENWSWQFSLPLFRGRKDDLGDDAVDIVIMMECMCVFLSLCFTDWKIKKGNFTHSKIVGKILLQGGKSILAS